MQEPVKKPEAPETKVDSAEVNKFFFSLISVLVTDRLSVKTQLPFYQMI